MSQRKRIYVAYAGGTIGMKPTDGGYAPVTGHLTAQVRDQPQLHTAEVPELSICEYEPLLDSANARPSDWLRIARDLAQHRHHYDGFVVLHGTDTMAYTASALAFTARQPRRILDPKTRQTSRTSSRAATSTAVSRFWRPSLRRTPSGIWEPVTTTGLPRPRSRKARADAV